MSRVIPRMTRDLWKALGEIDEFTPPFRSSRPEFGLSANPALNSERSAKGDERWGELGAHLALKMLHPNEISIFAGSG